MNWLQRSAAAALLVFPLVVSAQTVLSVLMSHILPLVPGMAERLEEGASLLDLGCGRGRALLLLAERFPASTFQGYDLSAAAIAYASDEAAAGGLENVRFEARDLSTFDRDADPDAFDYVTTFDAVHDQAKPLALLQGIRRTLRPGGVYLMQDIQGSSHVHENLDHPGAPLLYMISCMHCMTVSRRAATGSVRCGARRRRASFWRRLASRRSTCICSSTIRSTRTSSSVPDAALPVTDASVPSVGCRA